MPHVHWSRWHSEVELYAYRPAFEADPQKLEPLAGAITRAHQAILGGTPASPRFSSMWRDINCFQRDADPGDHLRPEDQLRRRQLRDGDRRSRHDPRILHSGDQAHSVATKTW